MTKSIFFTLCSNNYLAQAITLANSLKRQVKDLKFVIGLVDLLDPAVDYQVFDDLEILPCFDLGFAEFEEMLRRYNVIEFNTAVKPFYFEYLFDRDPSLCRIYYLDPDLYFYKGFELLDQILTVSNIVLTPMITDPGRSSAFDELISLRHGMYNLGFIGMKRTAESLRFLGWWKDRLREYCLIDKGRGIFVDQKWIDLAPLFFEGIQILKHKGCNMAWWNFNDRKLLEIDGSYYVNSVDYPLIFFHFSGFKPGSSSITERSGGNRFDYSNLPELEKMGLEYGQALLANHYESLHKIKPSLKFFVPQEGYKTKLKISLKRIIRSFLP